MPSLLSIGIPLNSSLDLNFLFSAGPVNLSKISFISLFSSTLENLSIVSSTPFSATSLTLSFNLSLTTTPSLAALTWALVNLPLLTDLL